MKLEWLFRIFLLLSLVVPAQAGVVRQVENGRLVGASGVLVGGGTYDVAFKVGACVSLFDGCDGAEDFIFRTISDGAAASRALLDQVFLNGTPEGDFLSMLDHVPGCTSPAVICAVLTPYERSAFAPSTVNTYSAVQSYQFSFFSTIAQQALLSPSAAYTYAVWSNSSTGNGTGVLPEPPTSLLAAAALAICLLLARRRPAR